MNRYCLYVVCILVSLLTPVAAQAAEGAPFSWLPLVIGLCGGLALFLAGLDQLSAGLKRAAGDALKIMLSKLTTNRFMGAVSGALVTGILNSSSVTTVLVVGFVTAGVMNLQQSVGVIMGANIGSTVTAQVLAFNIAQYALLPVAAGFFMTFIGKQDGIRNWGMMVMGLGMVFFGMSVMSDAMYPLRGYAPFLEFLQRMESPVLGILAGALFTGLVQSSAATVGIAIAMAGGGLLSLEAGIGLALGANIGTCITALMAALGKPPEAVRAAVVHISFNILGVLIWLPFIPELAHIASTVSPESPDVVGAARIAADVPRQIANANTIFNVFNTMLFLPFTPLFAYLATRVVPKRPEPPAVIAPVYLDEALLEVPAMALEAVRRELGRAVELIIEMMNRYEGAIGRADFESIKQLVTEDDKIDILEQASVEYLGNIRGEALSERESREHQTLLTCAITLETLADVIEKDLVQLAQRARGINHERSEKTRKMLATIFRQVHYAVELLVPTINDSDQQSARKILELGPVLTKLQKDFLLRKSERLRLSTPDALKIARIEVSATDKLQRMYSLCKRIARTHLDD